jgi:hypothetical protein
MQIYLELPDRKEPLCGQNENEVFIITLPTARIPLSVGERSWRRDISETWIM